MQLVYGGKVLRDDNLIVSSILPMDADSVAIHLVVKQSAAQAERSQDQPSTTRHVEPPRDAPEASISETAPSPRNTQHVGTSNEDYQGGAPPARDGFHSDLYSQVFQTVYHAALSKIIQDNTQGTCSNFQGFPFVPNIIPLQVVGARTEGREDGQQAQAVHQYIMPILPVPYVLPQQINDRRETDNALNRRRRNAEDAFEAQENVRAMLEALGRRENNANIPRVRPAGNPPRRRQIQIRIHLNMRMLLQLAVLFFVVYQHCPPSRFLTLGILGLLLYLSTTQLGTRLLQRITGYLNIQRQAQMQQVPGEQNNIQQQAEGNVAHHHGNLPEHGEQQDNAAVEAPRGLVREVLSFVAGFFASLLPAADNRNLENDPALVQDIFRAGQN